MRFVKRAALFLVVVVLFLLVSNELFALKKLLKLYKQYQEVNMSLWLLGDIGAEKRLGKELQMWMHPLYSFEKDPKMNERVKKIFDRLTPHYNNRGLNFNVRVIKDNTPNAFVIPGGHVYVHTGMISVASSDDELAAVIAHELGHAERRHSMKNFRASTAAVAILNKAAKNTKDKETWGALIGFLTLMRFSRNQEREADDVGQHRMAAAGYDPAAQVALWEKFLRKYGENKSVLQYFNTHPLTSERVANARANLSKLGAVERTIFSNTQNVMTEEKTNILHNPSFEDKPATDGKISAWEVSSGEATICNQISYHGLQSLRLMSTRRTDVTRVLSDYIEYKDKKEFILTGVARTEDANQNIAIGIELFDSNKRLRDRVWLIESAPFSSSWTKFSCKIQNLGKQNIAFYRILLQNGLMTTGQCWFDDLRLKPAELVDPVNFLENGDFEYISENNVPRGLNRHSLLQTERSIVNTGYSSLQIGASNGNETGFTFSPIEINKLEPNKNLAVSFYFYAKQQFKGMLLIELLDVNGKPLSKRLGEVQFETSPGKWLPTSLVFPFKLEAEEQRLAKTVSVRLAAAIPTGQNLWVDSFVMRQE